MEITFEYSVAELQQIQKNLEDITSEISKSGNLVAKAAYIVERQAKINATGRPGPMVRTGRLRASITTQIDNPQQARVGTNVVYAPPVEFGREVMVGKGSRGGFAIGSPFSMGMRHTQAYPYLFPTIQQTKGEISEAVQVEGNVIEEMWSK
jgi:phage gpG-like protein